MIIEQLKNLLIFGVIVAVGVAINMVYKSNNQVCPDDFATSEERTSVMVKWTNDFFDKNVDATISDFSKARKNFYIENNCTKALQRVEDYKTGEVDKETRELIESVTGEKILKNQKNSLCPNDFETIGEEFISFDEWWKDFTANNPNDSISEMLKERRNFYIENNCTKAIKKHDEFFAGKTNEEVSNIVEVEIYNQKVYKLIENEKYSEAISLADEYLKMNPKSIDMWVHKSMAYYYLENCENASTSIKKANEMVIENPTFKEFVNKLSVNILDSNICK